MHFGSISSIGYIFFSNAVASALSPRAASSRSSVFQSVQKSIGRPGPVALASLYRKYNSKVPQYVEPPDDVRLAASGNDGTVQSIPESYDVEYLSPVLIGGQLLNLAFDTGSADLWVFSSSLSNEAKKGHSIYDPQTSPSSKRLEGYHWNVTYGDDSGASGDVYLDDVQVGNTRTRSQAIETAKQISPEFQKDVGSDGLLGLGFDMVNQVSPCKQKTFFSNVQGSLQSPLFTADLKKGTPGSYDFGFINPSKYTGSIEYVPVDSQKGFWKFSGSGYAVGNSTFNPRSIDAIMDTGTTLLLLPVSLVSFYYSKVESASYSSNQGGYVFTCSTKLPDLTLGLGGYKAIVPGSYLIYASIDADNETCYGALQRNTGIPFSVFGDVFIKSQFVVFDANGPRLGIASKVL